jgi:hypothetical protein
MAVLNCSANLFGLSKTEVGVFKACTVIRCPLVKGRGTRHGDSVARNDVSRLTIIRGCGIQ